MTHEDRVGIGGEPRGGPQIDRRLPDATDIPEYSNVEQSLASPLTEDITEYGAVQSFWLGED